MSIETVIKIAFSMGEAYGRKYESLYTRSGLDNAIGLDIDSLVTAAKAGAMQNKISDNKDRNLNYEGIAFANTKKEIVAAFVLHCAEKQKILLELTQIFSPKQTEIF